jgi:uncharacterized protein YacL
LWELQSIADSADAARRNRGRRGLDMLKRLQENGHLEVKIVEDDFPRLKEVDQKLVELAKNYHGKIVTNDFNLNKLAAVQGVVTLNINELTNAVKPVVLPGESMHVLIQKEGKEHEQGVAYLDDGTMVVVDHAANLISKRVDISVTSVIQTAAGKMIFGKLEQDRGQSTAQCSTASTSSKAASNLSVSSSEKARYSRSYLSACSRNFFSSRPARIGRIPSLVACSTIN